jgi:hypothetical protein
VKLKNQSQLAEILNWVASDTIRAFDLILCCSSCATPDVPYYEVTDALWERALYKLAKFTDYVGATENTGRRDRKRAVWLFNLESDTVIPHCHLADKPVIKFLRGLRHEFSHGAQSNGVPSLRRISIMDGKPELNCLSLVNDEQCKYNCPLRQTCHCVGPHDRRVCFVAVADVRTAIIEEMKSWASEYDSELSIAVNNRHGQQRSCNEAKPNPIIPWWYEKADDLFAFTL